VAFCSQLFDEEGTWGRDDGRGAVDAQPRFGVLSLACAEPRRASSEVSCIIHTAISNVCALIIVIRIDSEGVLHMELS